MLINTLFLSKPITEGELANKLDGSEKLFGFLFSEIMNVNDKSEKMSLVPELVGGNLIDYKSVFINYNFDSNVIISNTQSKDVKDPIISLSNLFLNSIDSQVKSLNDAEKIIYSPQQFVSSFSQLIKSLLNNDNQTNNVELKLFANNFILSQNVELSQLPSIEKFLLETIENEPTFSLTVNALDKQILFEVFSQVVPSLISGNRKNYLEGNLEPSEYKKIISDVFSYPVSEKNNTTTNAVEIDNNKFLADKIQTRNLTNSDISNPEGKVIINNFIEEPAIEDGNILDTNLLQQKLKTQNNSDSILFEHKQSESKTSQIQNLNSDISANKNTENLSNEEFNKLENVSNLRNQFIKNRSQNLETNSIKSIVPDSVNSDNSVNMTDKPQIKIIIKGENQIIQTSTNKVVDSSVINKISEIIENSNESNQIEIITKINSLPNDSEKNISVKNSNLFQNHLVSERQLQNLLRTINTNNNGISNLNSNPLVSSNNLETTEHLTSNNTEGNNNSSNSTGTKDNQNYQNINKTNFVEQEPKVEVNSINKSEQNIKTDTNTNSQIRPTNINQSNLDSIKYSQPETASDNLKSGIRPNTELKQQTDNGINVLKSNDTRTNSITENEISPEAIVKEKIILTTEKENPNQKTVLSNKVDENQIALDKNLKTTKVSDASVSKNSFENQVELNRKNPTEIRNYQNLNKNESGETELKVEVNSTNKSEQNIKTDTNTNTQIRPTNINQNNLDSIKYSQPETASDNLKSGIRPNTDLKQQTDNGINVLKSNNTRTNSITENEISHEAIVKEKIILTTEKENPNQKTVLSNKVDENQIALDKNLKTTKVSDASVSKNSFENQVELNRVNPTEIRTIKDNKLETNKTNEEFLSKNSEVKNDTKNPASLKSDLVADEENLITNTLSNSKNQKELSSSNSNSIRVVSERPAKSVIGLNSETTIVEKQIHSETTRTKFENQKEINLDNENVNNANQQNIKNEVKADLNNKDESSRNANYENKSVVINENSENISENETVTDFQNHLPEIDKKTFQASQRMNSESIFNNNKFDISKFLESKSLENFVRAINNNNLNYRAELNHAIQNNNSVELRLYPEELGRVKIVIETLENIVSAKIEVQSEQIRNIILSNLPRLRESLNQEGLNVQNLNVYLGTEEQKNNHNTNQKKKNSNNKMIFDSEEQKEEVKIKNLGYNTIEYLA